MATSTSSWWSTDRIDATVTREYIYGKVGLDKQDALHRPLAFGDSLTDDTYIEWILIRGRRLFLIFDDIGHPDYIFEAIDRSFDDDDLPLSPTAIKELRLSGGRAEAVEKKFLRRQYYYIVQELEAGSHVDYQPDEVVPVEPVAKSIGRLPTAADKLLATPEYERVHVAGQLFLRHKIVLGNVSGVDRIHFVLHFKALQKLKHPHLVSIWATYTQGDDAYVLLSPCLGTTLKAFLDEPPKRFKQLAKPEKRELMIRWMHCLTSAVAYLHEHGYAHQALRPSNIFIDGMNTISLGPFAALDALEDKDVRYDRETYEHASPELWQRKPIFQELSALRSTLPGGGRTGRRIKETFGSPPSTSPPLPSFSFRRASDTESVVSHRTAQTTRPSTQPRPRTAAPPVPAGAAPARHVPCVSTISFATDTNSTAPTDHTTASNSSGASASTTTNKRAIITTFSTASLPSLFPSDVYSLCTIHTHLLTAVFGLSSRTAYRYTSNGLRTHLGKLNRSAGRGGAPADSSFHANPTQLARWLEKLEKETGKKSERAFFAVGALIGLVGQGLRRTGAERWAASDGAREIRNLIETWVGPAKGCTCKMTDPERKLFRGPNGFVHGVNRYGEVEIGHRNSAGDELMLSPPLTESEGSSSGARSMSGSSGSRRGGESVVRLDGIGYNARTLMSRLPGWPLRTSVVSSSCSG